MKLTPNIKSFCNSILLLFFCNNKYTKKGIKNNTVPWFTKVENDKQSEDIISVRLLSWSFSKKRYDKEINNNAYNSEYSNVPQVMLINKTYNKVAKKEILLLLVFIFKM